MIRIGIVGVGFMGMIHYLAASGLRGGRVTAVCSRDPKKLAGDWRGIQGNFGPPGEVMDLSGIKKFDHLDGLLADPELDLIDICNPTHLHAETAIRALAAGKHVLVEKPIALTAERRRGDGASRHSGWQAADGGARAAVLSGVRLCRRSHSRRPLGSGARRPFQASDRHGLTGRSISATPPKPAARRWTCISTTPTSSA